MHCIGIPRRGFKHPEQSGEKDNERGLLTCGCHIVEWTRFFIANDFEESLHYLRGQVVDYRNIVQREPWSLVSCFGKVNAAANK